MQDGHHRRLAAAVALAIICFSLAPLFLVAGYLSNSHDQAYRAKVSENLRVLAENKRRTVDLFLSERLSQLVTLTGSSSMARMRDPAELERLFTILRSTSNMIVDLGVIDSEGNYQAYVGPYQFKDVNYKNEDWFRETLAKGSSISDVFLGFRRYPHVSLAAMGREGDKPYVLRATINADSLETLLRSAHMGRQGDVYLVNAAMEQQTRSRTMGNVQIKLDFPPQPRFTGTRVENITLGGTRYIWAMTWLETKDWMLLVREDPREEFAALESSRTGLFWLLAVGVTIIVLGAAGAAKFLVFRLQSVEREKAELDANLVQSSKMAALGKLAAGVAHEINNPLAIIKENAGWLRDVLTDAGDHPKPEDMLELRETADKIEMHVERAKNVTHRLLGFARRVDPVRDPVDLTVLAAETIAFLEGEARSRNIAITKAFSPLPPVVTDASQLQQVLLNLIDNAIDSIGKSGSITVSVGINPDNDRARIEVHDSGPGIPADVLPRIFDPFFTTKKVGEGTGLGLAISHSIIEKLGGEIHAASEVGQGASFIIELPRTSPDR